MLLDSLKDKKILLHCCCAPCSCSIIEQMIAVTIDLSLFFYNPNIHPLEEYEKRRDEICRYAQKRNIPFIDAEYDVENWFSYTKGFEECPERGSRCSRCFEMRFKKTALYASRNQFPMIASTLSISRWKDASQIHEAGKKAVLPYQNVQYFAHTFRTEPFLQLSREICAQENFYRQKYCGCTFSRGKI
jgi:epoxyqueuosine reductase